MFDTINKLWLLLHFILSIILVLSSIYIIFLSVLHELDLALDWVPIILLYHIKKYKNEHIIIQIIFNS